MFPGHKSSLAATHDGSVHTTTRNQYSRAIKQDIVSRTRGVSTRSLRTALASAMLNRVVDNSLFSTSRQDSKLIALILNYSLPSQTYKLLQKGATAMLCNHDSLKVRSPAKSCTCCSADMHLCRWRCKQVVQCCSKFCTAPVSCRSTQARQTYSNSR